MSTCDCSELEDELYQMEKKVEEAEDKIIDCRNSLTAQEEYTQDILDLIDSILDIEDIDDLKDFIDVVEDIADVLVKASLASIIADFIAVLLAYYSTTLAASIALEGIYQNRLNYWSNELEGRKKKYDEIEGKLDKCYSDLTGCGACAGEFVNKGECGGECDGCGRWYCISCFDGAIEAAELAAGEPF